MRRWMFTVAAAALAVGVVPSLAQASDRTLNVAWGATGPIENTDAYFNTARYGIWFAQMVWDGLLYRNPETGEYEGLLAKECEFTETLNIRCTLKEGIEFHNGEPFDADDVVYTLNFVSNPDNKVKAQTNVRWIEGAEKVDQYTVDIKLKYPFPQAFEFLSMAVPIYPNEYYAEVGPEGMAKQPVGTGPFIPTLVRLAERYEFKRNPNYAHGEETSKGAVKVERLVAREIRDVQTQLAELLSGGIDFTADIETDHVEQIDNMPGLRGIQAGTMRTGYIGFDAAGRSGFEPVTNLKVRQAMAMALNRESFVKNLIRGDSRVIHTPCYPTQFGCDADAAVQWEYNPEKARELLKEAGYPDGFEVEFYTFRPNAWAEAFMADWAKVGIRARLTRMPYNALRDLQWEGGTPVFFMDWGSYSIQDVSAITSHFFKGGPDDFARDEEVIEWLEAGDSSTDPEFRAEKYSKAIERITEQLYWLPVFNHVRNYGYNADLDFKPYEDEIPRFWQYGWKN